MQKKIKRNMRSRKGVTQIMIPKIIHYCWFGGKELPELAKKCLASWKKYCPDYEIKCWNESNFDINSNRYVKEAYENKKYAFVTDYVRLYALYNEGGIYVDTDLEIIKPLDEFLKDRAFSGFENGEFVPTGIMASEKNLPIIKELMDYYTGRGFVKEDGTLDTTTNTETITGIFIKKGLKLNNQHQVIDDFSMYPADYFCPIDSKTKQKNITTNTYTIHWFASSWIPTEQRVKEKAYKVVSAVIGEKNVEKIISAIKRRKYE